MNGCTKRLESFQCPVEEESWVAFLWGEHCDHHWLTKGAFYMKIPAYGIPRVTLKLCLPIWRGYGAEFVIVTPLSRTVLCSDDSLALWVPGDGLPASSVYSHLQDLPIHSEPFSIINGSCWMQVCFQICT